MSANFNKKITILKQMKTENRIEVVTMPIGDVKIRRSELIGIDLSVI